MLIQVIAVMREGISYGKQVEMNAKVMVEAAIGQR